MKKWQMENVNVKDLKKFIIISLNKKRKE